MMIRPSKILKRNARILLTGRYYAGACITLSATAFALLLEYLLSLSGFSPLGDAWQIACYWILYTVILLLNSVLAIGLTKFFLNLSTGQPASIQNLYYGFTHDADRFIIASAFRYGLFYLAWIPALIYYMKMPETFAECTPQNYLTLLGLALIALIWDAAVLLQIGQSVYILLEDPYCSVPDSMRRSMELMRGHRAEYLKLFLSFLGYALLEIGTFGLGRLWIRPYLEMTMIQFYLELTGRPFLPVFRKAGGEQVQEPEQASSENIM